MLVKHGANLNAQDRHGVTPLMAALYGFKHFDAQFDSFDENFIELLKNEQVDLSLTTKVRLRSIFNYANMIYDSTSSKLCFICWLVSAATLLVK